MGVCHDAAPKIEYGNAFEATFINIQEASYGDENMLYSMSSQQEKTVGFVKRAPSNVIPEQTPPQDFLFAFDAGGGISFADASHNMGVFGTTGSGKTESIIFPCVSSMIGAGFAGLVVDVKGNVANYVRMIAREHGRENDVVEFGPGPAATPINLLWGKTLFEIEQILRSTCTNSYSDKHNSCFYEEGVQKMLDVLLLYRIMCEKLQRPFRFDLYNVLLNDFHLAHDAYEFYLNKLHDHNILEELQLVQRIKGDTLHYILPPSTNPEKRSRGWDEQNSYRMHYPRQGIERLLRTPGMVKNFLGNGQENLDIARRIYDENKIVVLRLAVETGLMGEKIARLVTREFYQAVYRNGKKLPEGKYTFLVADEVQDFYSSDKEDPLNDNSFVAKCREFRNIAIYGTQSVAAMQARASGGLQDCEAFVANCNVRVFLFSDDKATMDLAPDTLPKLDTLKSGHGNLVKFDVKTRDHVVGSVSMNNAYREFQELLARQRPHVPDTDPVSVAEPTKEEQIQQLREIMEEAEWLRGHRSSCGNVVPDSKEPDPVPEQEKRWVFVRETPESKSTQSPYKRRDTYIEDIDTILESLRDAQYKNDNGDFYTVPYMYHVSRRIRSMLTKGLPEDLRRKRNEANAEDMQKNFEHDSKVAWRKFLSSDAAKKLTPFQANASFLQKTFPDLIAENGKSLVPDGWVPGLCWHLAMIRAQALPLYIMEMFPGRFAENKYASLIFKFDERSGNVGSLLQEDFDIFCSEHCLTCGKEEGDLHYGLCDCHSKQLIWRDPEPSDGPQQYLKA